ncbi:MAG: hypothetical protein ACR2O4_10645, partial [Hyphomicrobiaceae bacterium]
LCGARGSMGCTHYELHRRTAQHFASDVRVDPRIREDDDLGMRRSPSSSTSVMLVHTSIHGFIGHEDCVGEHDKANQRMA